MYGEIQDVGTLRPFFQLPSGVYGSMEVAGEGVRGLGLSGELRFANRWGLSYDAYFGTLAMAANEPFEKNPESRRAAARRKAGDVDDHDDNVIGARAIVSTPVEGLNVRVSGYYSPTPPAGESGVRWVVGPALEYLGERLTVRAEYYYHRDHEIAREHTAYAEAAYFVTEHVQLGARAEFFQADLVGTPVKSSLLEHREIAATVNYWFSPQFALKVSGHAIDGNRFAAPTLLDTRCSRGRCRGART